jgi:peptide/nickel transport system permease protein
MSIEAVPVLPVISEMKQARKENRQRLVRRPGFIIGSVIVLLWVLCAAFGKLIAQYDPFKTVGDTSKPPSGAHWFGTDRTGRDVFSRVVIGAIDVLKVAPAAATISVILGVILGVVMGFKGGWFDAIVGRVLEAIISLPAILIGLLAATTLGRSAPVVIGIVAAAFTPIVARTVRSAVMTERELDYVTSARLRGESDFFIMFREVLPNVSGPIIVEFTIRIGYAIFVVATLSFLGAGPPAPSPDWGAQVADSYAIDIISGYWWTTMFPALAIASLVIAVNLIADAIQSVMDD